MTESQQRQIDALLREDPQTEVYSAVTGECLYTPDGTVKRKVYIV